MTDTKQDEQYTLAQGMTDDYSRVLNLCARINERNGWASEPWEEMVERIIDEHIGDPLCIEWHGSTSSNPAWGDVEWDVTEIEVTLGTGGPARGINFCNGNAYCWHQDWGTPRVEDCRSLDNAEILAAHWGIEDF